MQSANVLTESLLRAAYCAGHTAAGVKTTNCLEETGQSTVTYASCQPTARHCGRGNRECEPSASVVSSQRFLLLEGVTDDLQAETYSLFVCLFSSMMEIMDIQRSVRLKHPVC